MSDVIIKFFKSDTEARAIASFLLWQGIPHIVIEDGAEVLRTTKGKPEAIVYMYGNVYKGYFNFIDAFREKGMIQI